MVYQDHKLKSKSTEAVIYIITASWGINIFCSIMKFIQVAIEKFKKLRSSKKVDIIVDISSKQDDQLGTEDKNLDFTKIQYNDKQ